MRKRVIFNGMWKQGIYKKDAREIQDVIKSPVVDVTITSPPYFDLKDYGSRKQIGFGQEYPEYLNDLGKVFSSVYEVTRPTGTLWVIVDTFRKDGEVIPLPFDIANVLKNIGWKLQDIVIWGKERTVPWAHKGQSRSMFEYVMFFSKTGNYKYNVNRVRDYENLKRWWIKYPERYNPLGKNLDEIWKFDIPTQGSWGNKYVDHFCPLPEGLVERIISLTTSEGDVVLDPFSGSGTVPAQANFMKRKYVGFELNGSYIKMFKRYLRERGAVKRKEYEISKRAKSNRRRFADLIIDLRVLKFARVLRMQLLNSRFKVEKIYVSKKHSVPKAKNKLVAAEYVLLLKKTSRIKLLQSKIDERISVPPLSKFGVAPSVRFVFSEKDFFAGLPKKQLFVYTESRTNSSLSSLKEAVSRGKSWTFVSEINVRVKEGEWEQSHLT